MPARVCPNCETPWPSSRYEQGKQVAVYTTCPECEEPTAHQMRPTAIPLPEARSREYHAEFNRAYLAREDARIERGEPSPEDIAHAELEPWLAELDEIRHLPEVA